MNEPKVESNLSGQRSGTQSYVVQQVGPDKIETNLRIHGSWTSHDTVVSVVYDGVWRLTEGPLGKFVKTASDGEPFRSIAVGKDWTADMFWQPLHGNASFKWTEHGHVGAWESVTLADGHKYDAFRITYRHESAPVEGTGFQVMTAGLTSRKLVERIVEWYAPAINRYVKRTYEYSRDGTIAESYGEELTSYKRGN